MAWNQRTLLITLALLSSAAFAGCVEPTGPALSAAQAPGDAELQPPAPRLGLASDLPLTRNGTSLDEAPAWAVGEWWQIAYEDRLVGGEGEITRVVAGAQGPHYLVGMPADAFDDMTLLLHFPAMGRVNSSNLGFDAHDRPIRLLEFPLEEGRTWTTEWYSGAPLEAEVVSVDGNEARVELQGEGPHVTLTYDADLGAIREMDIAGYLHYEVVDHGFAYDGTVKVPHGQDLVFCHGRLAAVQGIEPCAASTSPDPEAPRETITLPPAYDRVSFGLLLADIATAGSTGVGTYGITVEAPDGSTFEARKLPGDPAWVLEPHGLDDPGGNWEATYVAGGPGIALLEGVAYDVLTVADPAG